MRYFCGVENLAAHSVDCLVFALKNKALHLLLVRWSTKEFGENWALPGHFVFNTESLEESAIRILKEWTGLENLFLEPCKNYSHVDRVPGKRVISTSFVSLIDWNRYMASYQGQGLDVQWVALDKVPQLVFDHNQMVADGIAWLREMTARQPIGKNLLPEFFTLSELQEVYELLMQRELDRRNFRKKILSVGVVEETGIKQSGVAHRAAKLYQFNLENYQKYRENGLYLSL